MPDEGNSVAETACPYCGAADAYVGFARVKCANEHCAHFDEVYLSELNDILSSACDDDSFEVEDTDPTWMVDYLNGF